MTLLKFLAIMALLLFAACAKPNVENSTFDLPKDRLFSIGTIRVPCNLECLPSLVSYQDTAQIEMLQNIDHREILRVLADAYGIQLDSSSQLEVESSPANFMQYGSDSPGSCVYIKNRAVTSRDNIVDIEYDLDGWCGSPKPITAKLSYEVKVRSGGKLLVRHSGTVDTFKYKHWLNNRDIREFVASAKSIPVALKRDIDQQQR